MNESLKKIWEKIEKLPGGDSDPFETPIGPTDKCLSSNKMVSFVENGENNVNILLHLGECKSCRERISGYKGVR